MIAWQDFTPWTSLAGGMLIGASAAVLITLLGRVAGISGIVGSLLAPANWRNRSTWGWRLAFVLGMLAAPWLWRLFAPLPALQTNSSTVLLVLAGVLVGVGTRMGSGCTSGHGVCGLSRLSLRSLVATGVFMATGVATVFVLRHLLA